VNDKTQGYKHLYVFNPKGQASEFGCRLVGEKGLEYLFSSPKSKEQIQRV